MLLSVAAVQNFFSRFPTLQTAAVKLHPMMKVMLVFAESQRRKWKVLVCLFSPGDRDVPGKRWPGSFCHLFSKGNPCGGGSASPFCDRSPAAHPLPRLHFVQLSFLHRATLSFPSLFSVVHFLFSPLLCCINLSRLSDTKSAKMNG